MCASVLQDAEEYFHGATHPFPRRDHPGNTLLSLLYVCIPLGNALQTSLGIHE